MQYFCYSVTFLVVSYIVNTTGVTNLMPISHVLALLGAHHILHVSRIRVNCITLYIKHLHVLLKKVKAHKDIC